MPIISVNNHDIAYTDTYPNGAPTGALTFIFVHGLGSSQNYFYPILPCLKNYRCITMDTYGAARSTYTGDTISIASIAADVVGVLDALRVSKAVAVGHSMGGLVVTLLGAQYANRVEAVVAIGPTHPSEGLEKVMTERSELASSAGMEPLADKIPAGATGSRSSSLVQSFIRELLLRQNPHGYSALCQAIATAPVIDYSAVTAPFLLIAGDEDKSASMEGCEHIYTHVSSERKHMQVLSGVGHWHCLEAPEAVGQAITHFAKDQAQQDGFW
ncbi:alpha/beta hydrolase [Aspergillus sclerotioniger CBS 115572]|uniref:Alpha/beta hydrolase n=1 Tax=Aspergillus sclerotioniger CBS 115572 TaxID=1450535 RepID=A0A317VL16_9EURO|nr:alpha/beta hydrolase [Aspergillus sclerotioniger CBS 115572]PWY73817.1 alpha/beta hydrolase [Aspergillus sclerotioniger CBS 115572]